jgi:hypothetical protein
MSPVPELRSGRCSHPATPRTIVDKDVRLRYTQSRFRREFCKELFSTTRPMIQLLPQTVFVLLLVVIAITLTWLHHARVMHGHVPTKRPIEALQALRYAMSRGAETGHPLHIAPGAGMLGAGEGTRAGSAAMIAGLLSSERIATEAALNGIPLMLSTSDAAAYLALRGTIRQAYQAAGQAQDFDPARVQLLAHHDDMAYATGVTTLYGRQQLEASVMLGSFGQEFLLIGEDGARRNLPQIVGSASSTALPLMMLSTPSTLIGEELYAAEAYLTSEPSAQARLLTQDTLRTLLIILIIGGFIYGLLQPVLGLPPLPGLR